MDSQLDCSGTTVPDFGSCFLKDVSKKSKLQPYDIQMKIQQNALFLIEDYLPAFLQVLVWCIPKDLEQVTL